MNYIYLIGAFPEGKRKPQAVKIGVAKDPKKRLDSMQTGNHLELKIVATWEAGSLIRAHYVEQSAHYCLRGLRIRGEWFKPDYRRILGFLNGKVLRIPYEDPDEDADRTLDELALEAINWHGH